MNTQVECSSQTTQRGSLNIMQSNTLVSGEITQQRLIVLN